MRNYLQHLIIFAIFLILIILFSQYPPEKYQQTDVLDDNTLTIKNNIELSNKNLEIIKQPGAKARVGSTDKVAWDRDPIQLKIVDGEEEDLDEEALTWEEEDHAFELNEPIRETDEETEAETEAEAEEKAEETPSRLYGKNKALTSTGWSHPAKVLNFGEKGLVGNWWRRLEVLIDYQQPVTITGVDTDVKIPYTLQLSNDGQKFKTVLTNHSGSKRFTTSHKARFAKVNWPHTFGTSGIHWQLVGTR